MFKVKLAENKAYNELPQVNPLRWKTMYLEGDTFKDQSGWLRCKDFFNDNVAFFQGKVVFSIYHYKNDIKKNKEGLYVLLANIKDRKQFCHNLEVLAGHCLAEHLEWVCPIYPLDALPEDQILLLIPNCFWENTYRISLITMCIRLCNYGIQYECWEDFWKDEAPAKQVDGAFDEDAFAYVKTKGFILPDKVKQYWYYAGPDWNSQVRPNAKGEVVHDNGVCNWVLWMNMEDKQ